MSFPLPVASYFIVTIITPCATLTVYVCDEDPNCTTRGILSCVHVTEPSIYLIGAVAAVKYNLDMLITN